MKKILVIASAVVLTFSFACGSEPSSSDGEVSTDLINNPATATEGEDGNAEESLPKMEFVEQAIDFGEISQGEKVKKRFRFKNTGKTNLIISDAKGSCGCTVPAWPKQPIKPGQEGEVEVVFDSNGKKGRQHKTVTLIANTVPNTTVIALKGDVIVPN